MKLYEHSLSPSIHDSLRAAGAALIFAVCTLPPISAAGQQAAPPSLSVPDDHVLVFEGKVLDGVQAYRCTPQGEYALVGPTAVVRGAAGELVAHYAGPTWQHQDGSSVVGKAVAHRSAPHGVDELLVQVVEHGARPGLFDSIDYIQRIATRGGVAPSSCDPLKQSTLVVSYSATYRFWAPKK